MAEAIVARLGEPFVSSKGSGLGTVDVRKMIEGVHGGSVDVRSAVGARARVSLEVPRRQ